MRNFLWSGGSLQAKESLISWRSVCLPKLDGSLGFRRIQDLIKPSMVKLGWVALTSSSLWASWFKAIYFKGFSPCHPSSLLSGSCIWNHIKRFSHLIFQNIHWQLGDGKNTSFWHDKWHGPLSIAHQFLGVSLPWTDCSPTSDLF